jgi:thioredoxin-like negative regulator of GroEL
MLRLVFFLFLFTSLNLPLSAHPNEQEMPILPITAIALESIYKSIEANTLNKASLLISKAEKEIGLRNPDREYLERAKGYLNISKKNYKEAILNFNAALKGSFLPLKVEKTVIADLSQLLYLEKRYLEVYKLLKNKKELYEADQTVARLFASTLLSLNKVPEAVLVLESLIEKLKKPEIDIYLTLSSSYLKVKAYAKAISILESAIKHYPQNLDLIKLLVTSYYERRDFSKATSLMFSAYEQGIISQKADIFFLAELTAVSNSPSLGVKVLEGSISSKKLADSYQNRLMIANLNYQARNLKVAADQFLNIYLTFSKDKKLLLRAVETFTFLGDREGATKALKLLKREKLNKNEMRVLITAKNSLNVSS